MDRSTAVIFLLRQRRPAGAAFAKAQIAGHSQIADVDAVADRGRDGIAQPSAVQGNGPGADAAVGGIKGGGFAVRGREGDLIGIVCSEDAGSELIADLVIGDTGKSDSGDGKGIW